MYLILCWSYLNNSLCFVGEKKRIQKKNRILNRNRNILVKKSQLDYFPKSFSPNMHPIFQFLPAEELTAYASWTIRTYISFHCHPWQRQISTWTHTQVSPRQPCDQCEVDGQRKKTLQGMATIWRVESTSQ